jgi:hypothetical protein
MSKMNQWTGVGKATLCRLTKSAISPAYRCYLMEDRTSESGVEEVLTKSKLCQCSYALC